jgi:hypothetical protein
MNRSTKHGGGGGAKAAEGVLVLILEIHVAAIANGRFSVQLVKNKQKTGTFVLRVCVCALCIVHCELCVVRCASCIVKRQAGMWHCEGAMAHSHSHFARLSALRLYLYVGQ